MYVFVLDNGRQTKEEPFWLELLHIMIEKLIGWFVLLYH